MFIFPKWIVANRVLILVSGAIILELISLILSQKLSLMISWMILGMLSWPWKGWQTKISQLIKSVRCWKVTWFMKPRSVIWDLFTRLHLIIVFIVLIIILRIKRKKMKTAHILNNLRIIIPQSLLFILIISQTQKEWLLEGALQKTKVLLVSEKKRIN